MRASIYQLTAPSWNMNLQQLNWQSENILYLMDSTACDIFVEIVDP